MAPKKLLPVAIIVILIIAFTSYLAYKYASENRELKEELSRVKQEISELRAKEATSVAETTETTSEAEKVETTDKQPAEEKKSEVPKIEKQICLIKEADEVGGEFFLSVDYVQLLTGEAAKKEALRRGWDPNIEYCIINDNPKIRKFRVSRELKNGEVKLVSKSDGVVPEGYFVSFGQWFDIYNGMGEEEFCNSVRNGVYWIWIKGDEVLRIEQQYFP